MHPAYFVVLNYDAMKHLNLRPYAVLVLLLSACSGPSNDTGAGAPQQANSNSAPQPQIAQGSAPVVPSPTPLTAIPPVAKADPNSTAGEAKPNAGNARAPKLVVPAKKIDYGKQPQEKTLVRAIVIKNGGLANLNIDSVTPS